MCPVVQDGPGNAGAPAHGAASLVAGADGPVSPEAHGADAAPTDRDGVEAAGSAGDADGGADSLAIVLSDGSVYSISLPAAGDDQETAMMVRLAKAPCGAGVSVAAAASAPSGSSLAVIVGGAGGEAVAHIHSPQVRGRACNCTGFQLHLQRILCTDCTLLGFPGCGESQSDQGR